MKIITHIRSLHSPTSDATQSSTPRIAFYGSQNEGGCLFFFWIQLSRNTKTKTMYHALLLPLPIPCRMVTHYLFLGRRKRVVVSSIREAGTRSFISLSFVLDAERMLDWCLSWGWTWLAGCSARFSWEVRVCNCRMKMAQLPVHRERFGTRRDGQDKEEIFMVAFVLLNTEQIK